MAAGMAKRKDRMVAAMLSFILKLFGRSKVEMSGMLLLSCMSSGEECWKQSAMEDVGWEGRS
jgi:hypothetical protein